MKSFITLVLILTFIEGFTQTVNDLIVAETYYDLQTNRSVQNRIVSFTDGCIGVTWNWGNDFPVFIDLGSGYTFYDGISWSPPQKVFDAMNPSYSRFGSSGEIIVGEGSSDFKIAVRNEKGTGNWIISDFPPPAGVNKLYSPLVFTSGENNQILHVLCMKKITWPGVNPPNTGQVLYSRSTDLGATWDVIFHEFETLGPNNYYGFSEQAYAVADPVGDHLAFVVGDYFTDMLLLKSDDGGNTWASSTIWNHPYDFFLVGPGNIEFFHCQDGSCTVAIDEQGSAHVVFGVSEIRVDNGVLSHFNAMGALGYWKEGMPSFPGSEHSLHPDSLAASGNLIKQYTHDFYIKPPYNSLGMATMPSMTIEGENITVVYSLLGGPMGFETNNHIFGVHSTNGGITWSDEYDITCYLIHIFDECIFPSIAPDSYMNRWTVVYQEDVQPGLAVNGDHEFDQNNIYVSQFEKACSPEMIEVDFIADTTTVHEGDTVFFTNLTESCPSPQWFEWSFDGGSPDFSELTHPRVQYNQEGTYFVSLHSYNGTSYDNMVKQNYIHVLPATGLDEINQSKPYAIVQDGKRHFTLKMTGTSMKGAKIFVLDLQGKKLMDLNHGVTSFTLKDQPAGVYFLFVIQDESIFSEKLVVY